MGLFEGLLDIDLLCLLDYFVVLLVLDMLLKGVVAGVRGLMETFS